MKDHIIICGLGNIGFHVFELLTRAGFQVAVITEKTHAEWAWQVTEAAGLMLYGDGRDDNLLLEAGIQTAKAILTLTNLDRINLAIAVDAQKLNPHIKIISRIFDSELGSLVSGAFDIEQVFSTSELAAPLFSLSVSHKDILGHFSFKNQHFIVTEQDKSSKKKLSGDVLGENNQKYLIARPLKKKKKKSFSFFNFMSPAYHFHTPVFVFFRRFLTVLFLIILMSTLFLSWAMQLSFTDTLYFVIATVSSVGYGDINFSKSSDALKYFGCLLMLTGTAIIAILFSTVTEILLIKRIPNIVGGFPVPRKDHIIVVGGDHIGERIVSSLIESGQPIVIIEGDPKDRYQEDILRQIALVNGNPKSENTLLRANIKSAKAILVITKDDIENLSISIAAKKLNPSIKEISQINNIKIGGTLKHVLSMTNAFSVPFIAGPYFMASLFRDNIIFAIEWHDKIIFLYEDKEKWTAESIPLPMA